MTTFVCRHCGSPDIDGLDAQGDPDWRYDPTNRDNAAWEGSEPIGFRCASCDEAAEDLVDLVHTVAG